VNLLIALEELGVHFSLEFEEIIMKKVIDADDPIAIATFLHYARYDEILLAKFSDKVNKIIENRWLSIKGRNQELLYREFWYILIFHKCPYLSKANEDRIVSVLRRMQKDVKGSSDMSMKLVADFMLDKSQHYSFISWHTKGARMIEEITYRTQNKTIFKSGSSEYLASL
jgi:hypothetical protein